MKFHGCQLYTVLAPVGVRTVLYLSDRRRACSPCGFALARQPKRCSGGCWLSCGLAPSALPALVSPSPLSSPALAPRAFATFGGSAPAFAARRAHPPERGVGAPLVPPARRYAPALARRVPAAGVRTVPWLAPRPRACLSAFGGLRNGCRRCAPFGVPARAVRPLRVRALSALRAPFARVLRAIALRPPALSGLLHQQKRGFGRAGRPLSGLRLRALRALLAPQRRSPSRALRPACEPFGLFDCICLCGFRLLCRVGVSGGCLAGVSNGALRLTDTPARLARERDFALTLP